VQAESSQQLVAAAVRRLRLDRGWSQEELAARADLHRTYVGSIERGQENVTLATLDKLAKALKVAPARLVSREGDGN
jgi:transcriptional regulator with XRE-family HTH domain